MNMLREEILKVTKALDEGVVCGIQPGSLTHVTLKLALRHDENRTQEIIDLCKLALGTTGLGHAEGYFKEIIEELK